MYKPKEAIVNLFPTRAKHVHFSCKIFGFLHDFMIDAVYHPGYNIQTDKREHHKLSIYKLNVYNTCLCRS